MMGRGRKETFLRRVNIFIIISIECRHNGHDGERGGENDAGSNRCVFAFEAFRFNYHHEVMQA